MLVLNDDESLIDVLVLVDSLLLMLVDDDSLYLSSHCCLHLYLALNHLMTSLLLNTCAATKACRITRT